MAKPVLVPDSEHVVLLDHDIHRKEFLKKKHWKLFIKRLLVEGSKVGYIVSKEKDLF